MCRYLCLEVMKFWYRYYINHVLAWFDSTHQLGMAGICIWATCLKVWLDSSKYKQRCRRETKFQTTEIQLEATKARSWTHRYLFLSALLHGRELSLGFAVHIRKKYQEGKLSFIYLVTEMTSPQLIRDWLAEKYEGDGVSAFMGRSEIQTRSPNL